MSWSSVVAAVLRRDWRIATSYRASFVLELGSIVFFLALFFYLGRLVSEEELAARESLSGDYFAFAAVGIALFRMVSLSLAGFAAKLREEQTTGTFEALMTAPVSPGLIVLASSAYDLLRGALSGLVVLLAAILIFGLDLDLAAGSLATATLAIVGSLGLFAAFGAAVAAVIVVLKRATALLGLALTGPGAPRRRLLPGRRASGTARGDRRGEPVHLGARRAARLASRGRRRCGPAGRPLRVGRRAHAALSGGLRLGAAPGAQDRHPGQLLGSPSVLASQSPQVAVVIPVWDDYVRWLPEAVASVREQDLPADIIVVDNASTTPVPALEGVAVVRTPRRLSAGAARNLGLAEVESEYVTFLDADDLLPEGTLRHLSSELSAHPEAAVAVSSIMEAGDRAAAPLAAALRVRPRPPPPPVRAGPLDLVDLSDPGVCDGADARRSATRAATPTRAGARTGCWGCRWRSAGRW